MNCCEHGVPYDMHINGGCPTCAVEDEREWERICDLSKDELRAELRSYGIDPVKAFKELGERLKAKGIWPPWEKADDES